MQVPACFVVVPVVLNLKSTAVGFDLNMTPAHPTITLDYFMPHSQTILDNYSKLSQTWQFSPLPTCLSEGSPTTRYTVAAAQIFLTEENRISGGQLEQLYKSGII